MKEYNKPTLLSSTIIWIHQSICKLSVFRSPNEIVKVFHCNPASTISSEGEAFISLPNPECLSAPGSHYLTQ